MGTGPLHVPKLPGIPGIEHFQGHSLPHQPLGLRLHRRRPRRARRWTSSPTSGSAIIGTGATAVQCVPHLARACQELYVFQRTPSSVDVRDNQPIDPDWFAQIATPGWQQRWLENFTGNQAGGTADEDLVRTAGPTSPAGSAPGSSRCRPRTATRPPCCGPIEESDFEKMEEIRARVDAIVTTATPPRS